MLAQIKTTLRNERLTPLLFAGPSLIILTILVLIPFIYTIWQSLISYNLQLPEQFGNFIGLDNYRQLLSNDEIFNKSFWNTAEFMVVGVAVELFLGLGIALLLQQVSAKARRLILSLLIVPMVLAPVAVGMIWKFLLNPQYGVVQYYAEVLGLTFEPLLSNPNTALWTIRAIDVWEWTPFTIIIFQAGLSTIPEAQLEAADIDGLSFRLKFRYIIWPAVLPILTITILLRLLEAFKIFDIVFILTDGGPGNATEMVSLYAHRNAFVKGNFGYAAAQVFILNYVVILLCSALFMFWRRRQSGQQL